MGGGSCGGFENDVKKVSNPITDLVKDQLAGARERFRVLGETIKSNNAKRGELLGQGLSQEAETLLTTNNGLLKEKNDLEVKIKKLEDSLNVDVA